VDLPHPRDHENPKFRALVDEIYTLMTRPEGALAVEEDKRHKVIGIGYRLPEVEISEITGLVEALGEYEGHVDLPELAEDLHMEIDDLFPVMEALEILRFARVSEGDIELTARGRELAEADILGRKKIFAAHLMSYVPIVRYIRNVLDARPDHRASEDQFITELEDYLSEDAAKEVLKTIIDWSRYAEVFAFDYDTGILSLENPT
jgi:NitT/TauT family transport system ATP-binding protein